MVDSILKITGGDHVRLTVVVTTAARVGKGRERSIVLLCVKFDSGKVECKYVRKRKC